MKKLRVVADTNVLISGLLFQGNPFKIMNCWRNEIIILITSPQILDEMTRVLDKKFHMPEDEIEEFRLEIIENGALVEPADELNVIIDDPDDNIILEAAIEGNADYIVSGDKHLKKLKEFQRIPIFSPSELVEIIEGTHNF